VPSPDDVVTVLDVVLVISVLFGGSQLPL